MTSAVFLLGAVIYAVAWILPVLTVIRDPLPWLRGKDEPYVPVTWRGWEAFRFAMTPSFTDYSFREWYPNCLSIGSGLSNFVLVATLLEVALDRGGGIQILRILVIACAFLNTHWLSLRHEPNFTLRVGYYLWAASYFVVSLALAADGGLADSWASSAGRAASVASIAILGVIALVRPSKGARASLNGTEAAQRTVEATGTMRPRGSYWLLFGGLAVAFLIWVLM